MRKRVGQEVHEKGPCRPACLQAGTAPGAIKLQQCQTFLTSSGDPGLHVTLWSEGVIEVRGAGQQGALVGATGSNSKHADTALWQVVEQHLPAYLFGMEPIQPSAGFGCPELDTYHSNDCFIQLQNQMSLRARVEAHLRQPAVLSIATSLTRLHSLRPWGRDQKHTCASVRAAGDVQP